MNIGDLSNGNHVCNDGILGIGSALRVSPSMSFLTYVQVNRVPNLFVRWAQRCHGTAADLRHDVI